MKEKNLTSLKIGESGTVSEIRIDSDLRRRLQDMGITRGTVIKHLFTGPPGDPGAYRITDSTVALRREDASEILIQ